MKNEVKSVHSPMRHALLFLLCCSMVCSFAGGLGASETVDVSAPANVGGNNQVGIHGTSGGDATISTTSAVTSGNDDISGIELGYDYGGGSASNLDISAGTLTLDIDHDVTGRDTQGEGISNNASAVIDLSGGLEINVAGGVTVSSGNSGGTTSGNATGAIVISSGASGSVSGEVSITNAGSIVSGQGGDNGSAYTPAAIELGAASNSLVKSADIINSGNITGGIGGVDISSGGNNGSGGISVNYTTQASSISNTGNITGGRGEVDGDNNGPGGDGGFGIRIGNVTGGFTIDNDGAGVISGGAGFDGSAATSLGHGGDGGSGVEINGSGSFTIDNNNSITGGNGANGAVAALSNSSGNGGTGGFGVKISGTSGLSDVITVNNKAGAAISSGAAGNAAADGTATTTGVTGASGIYIGSTATVNITNASGASIVRGTGGNGAGGGAAGADGYALELASAAEVNLDNDGTMTGGVSLSGGGTIRVQGAATVGNIEMNGGNAYIAYNAGGQAAADGTAANITGSTGADSVYVSSNGTVTGAINLGAGNNTLTIAGAGATISGSVTATTGNDTIAVADDFTISGAWDLGDGANGLAISNGATLVLSGQVQSSGTLGLDINGVLSQNSNNDLALSDLTVGNGTTGKIAGTGTGAISVAGTATINGDFIFNHASGMVTFTAASTLKGTGAIEGNMRIEGTHTPGNSIGTQNITGNVTYASGSVLEIEMDDDGSHDQINITGSLAFENGAKIKGIGLTSPIDGTHRLDVITYTETLTVGGTDRTDESFSFDDGYLDTASLDFSLNHRASNNTIYMTINSRDFNPQHELTHTDGLTRSLDTINSGGASGEVANLILELQLISELADLRQAFVELSPVQLTTTPAAVMSAAQNLGGVLSSHMGRVNAGASVSAAAKVSSGSDEILMNVDEAIILEEKKWTPFVELVVSRADQEDVDSISGYTMKNNGIVLGMDYLVSQRFLVGLSGSYMTPNIDSNDTLASSDIETYQGNLFASYFLERFYIELDAGYGYSDIDSERQVNFMGSTAVSSHHATYYSLRTETGYTLPLKHLELEPFCDFTYMNLDEDAYEESGAGGANLSIDSNRVESVRLSLGTRLSKKFSLDNGMAVKTELSYKWQHEFKDDAVSTTASFSGGAPFSTTGIEPDANHHVFGAGIKAFTSQTINVYCDYEYDMSDSYDSHNGILGIEVNF